MTQTMEAPITRQGNNGAIQRFNPKALASDSATLKGMLDASKDKLASVVPKHLTPDRLLRVALVAVSRSELLQKCTVSSILQCVMTGGQLGLDCSGVLGSAYMVPFFNSKVGAYEATFIPGYRGLIDLARRSGEIEDISAQVVYAEDQFDFEMGASPKLSHKPNFMAERDDGNIVGAYMVAFLKGNPRPHLEFMTRGQLLKVRDSSKAATKDEWVNGKKTGKKIPAGPWHDHFAEMCRKTVVRRGVKYLPMSTELSEALLLDDAQYPDEPKVHAASTVPSTSRTEALTAKLTSRPVSEGQTFAPDDNAPENVAAQDATTGEVIDHETGEIIQSAPEPEVEPSHQEPEPPPVAPPSDFTSHAMLVSHLESAAMTQGRTEAEMLAGLALAIPKAKENKVTPAERRKIWNDFVNRTGAWAPAQ